MGNLAKEYTDHNKNKILCPISAFRIFEINSWRNKLFSLNSVYKWLLFENRGITQRHHNNCDNITERMIRVIINQSWLIAVDGKSINFRDNKKGHDHDREYHVPRIVGGRAGPRVRGPRCCTSHWEARGFQALQRRAPESEQERAVPRRGASVVGCQWLIWRLYVYYDTRGRNTSSSLLANRSEKSAKPSRLRGAPHQVKRESLRASTEPVRQADRQTDRISTDQRSLRSRMIILAWCLFVIVSFLVAKNQAFLNAPIPVYTLEARLFESQASI
ncbi:hypothetical protein EAG_08462 [Camponotus floridanus]|uniref:Uncharacterized protein n=1 Tax=Camponotus floridanus TaxID=104421 RepID=E1ZYX5_CAMFO|nr:hypothetical protein EAG_08462 [Camponotus floridanus]